MQIETKNDLLYGIKITGLVILIAVLSGCPAVPHHGGSHGNNNSDYYDNGSNNSKHSYSRDY